MATQAGMNMEIDPASMRELRRQFSSLSDKMQAKALLGIFRKAAAPIRKAIRAGAPVGPTGNLRKAVAVRTKATKTYVSAVIGFKRPEGSHVHLVELGHGGPHPAPPHPFIRQSFNRGKAAALSVATASMAEVIGKVAAKAKAL